MEEVKQEQGPGEGAGAAIVKPEKSYKPAPGKAAAAKSTSDVKKAMMTKKKVNDAAWSKQELIDILSLLPLLHIPY